MQDGRFKVKIGFRTVLLLIAVFLLSVWSSAHAEIGNEIGNEAPDFALPNTENESITLSDHRGSENVIVIFYRGVF